MSRILIVAAHPDDEILGCGGTALNHIAAGDEVYSLVLGEGITSRYDKRELAPKADLEKLDGCYTSVCKFMGFKKYWHLNFPDNRFDGMDLLDVVKAVEKVIKEVRPDIIYTHFEADLNIDHRVTFQAVLTACRPVGDKGVKEIYAFETPSSTDWISPVNTGASFRPNVFVNVADTVEKKIKAMDLYESETAAFPHPRSPEALRIIAQRWGVTAGLPAAEAFILVRKIC